MHILTDSVVASGPQEQVYATVDDQVETRAHGLYVLALVVLLHELERDVRLPEDALGVQGLDGDVQHRPHFGQRRDELGVGGQYDGRADLHRPRYRVAGRSKRPGAGGPRRR